MSKISIDPPPSSTEDITHFSWKTWFQSIYNRFGGSSGPFAIPGFAKANLPPANQWASTSPAFSALIYVTDDVGGSIIAFSDGTNWRRLTDRNVIS